MVEHSMLLALHNIPADSTDDSRELSSPPTSKKQDNATLGSLLALSFPRSCWDLAPDLTEHLGNEASVVSGLRGTGG